MRDPPSETRLINVIPIPKITLQSPAVKPIDMVLLNLNNLDRPRLLKMMTATDAMITSRWNWGLNSPPAKTGWVCE